MRVSSIDGDVQTFTNPLGMYGSEVVGSPAVPDTFFEYEDVSPLTIDRIVVGDDGVPTVAVSAHDESIADASDIAVSPDGATLAPASGGGEYDMLRTSDLKPNGIVYPANTYPKAVAMTAAAGGIFAGGLSGAFSPDIVVYRLGDPSAPIASHDFGSSSQLVESGGVGFSPDGSRLFAITGDNGFQAAADTFRVLALPMLTTSTSAVSFAAGRVGVPAAQQTVTVTNTGTTDVSLQNFTLEGPNVPEFSLSTDCFPSGAPRAFAAGAQCHVQVGFTPSGPGPRSATLDVRTGAAIVTADIPLSGTGVEGYWLAAADGGVFSYGDAHFLGSMGGARLNRPTVGIAATPTGKGYWLVASDGGIFSYGDARFLGSMGGARLNRPIVGIAATPTGKGYWLVASDGGIFGFGDARFLGSTGGQHLDRPIVSVAATPTGKGYWLVGSDGHVYNFGDAHIYGAVGGSSSSAPVVRIVSSASGHGYLTLSGDGHLRGFGDAVSFGTSSATKLEGMALTRDGTGYWQTTQSGAVFAHGDAPTYGPAVSLHLNQPIVGIATTIPPF